MAHPTTHLFTITEENALFCVHSVEVDKSTAKQYHLRFALPAFGNKKIVTKAEFRRGSLIFATERDAIRGYREKVLLPRIAAAEESLAAFDERFRYKTR